MKDKKQPMQAHDTLFRHSMSIPRVAREFLEEWLPDSFLSLIDWRTLKIEKINVTDDSLSERREDVLYQIKAAGHLVCFYLLLEHQTKPQFDMAFRLLEYTLLIWRKHHKIGRKQRLPLVIPIVVHPGPRAWTGVRRLRDLIEIPEGIADWATGFAPDAGYEVVELHGLPIEKLAAGNLARAIMAALQVQRHGSLTYVKVKEIVALLFNDPALPEVTKLSRQLWIYLLHYSELKTEEIYAIVESTIPKEEQSNFMSTAERLKYEGRQEGLQEGLQEGRQEGKQEGLQEGWQEAIIEFLALRFKQVPERVKDAIRAVKQEDQLGKLLRASGTCDSLEAFTKAF